MKRFIRVYVSGSGSVRHPAYKPAVNTRHVRSREAGEAVPHLKNCAKKNKNKVYNLNEMFTHKSKYIPKILLIFIIFTFFVYSVLLCYALRIKTPTLFGVIIISTARQRASLQTCEVRHCRLCLTSAKQILINEVKVCLFLSDKSRTTHNA